MLIEYTTSINYFISRWPEVSPGSRTDEMIASRAVITIVEYQNNIVSFKCLYAKILDIIYPKTDYYRILMESYDS